jgi:hypothetical protein
MNILTNLLTGGFLAGYRTYVLGAIVAIQAVAGWALGDMSLSQLLDQLPEIAGGLGLMSLRAAVPAKE